ncbi:pseudouridylate synthase RPUSD2 [Scleropages formosus]|uniref:Pseudouridylate synthase RPUSD2 n=1 Tax=Scleropages formosus TaxID=113540 RepID=A0A8C9SB97_SCLFO|nr:RNA pseudouridylate synthase domain-containing protein 2 [Scleropages formosus]
MPWPRPQRMQALFRCGVGRVREEAKHVLYTYSIPLRLHVRSIINKWTTFSGNPVPGGISGKICSVGRKTAQSSVVRWTIRWRLEPTRSLACVAELVVGGSDTLRSAWAMEPRGDERSARIERAAEGSGEKRKSDETDEHERGDRRGKKRRAQRPGERYVPPPKKLKHGVSFGEEHFRETSYYFEGGLRRVRPYYFDFTTYCKGRWVGRTLLEVFSSEFRAESLQYYRQAARAGRIRLNESPVEDLGVTLKNNDFLRNTVHRHEPPVSACPLEILEDNEEVLVVNKPPSLPVHPCGRFRHNTVLFILGKERSVSGLHTVHRLDRLTSGVLLFARTLEVSKKLDQLVRDRQMEKEYVCRVAGEFPEGELVCEEPILVVSFKVGVCRVDPKGKPSRTVFQRLSWNGRSSVVRCLPLTGRTHQIRVHLQYLGHPILNDPIYGSAVWGPHRGKGGQVGMNDEELLKALVEEHRSKQTLHLLDISDESLPNRKHTDHEMAGSCSTAASVLADCESAYSAQSDVFEEQETELQPSDSKSCKQNNEDNDVGDASNKTDSDCASQCVHVSSGSCTTAESMHTVPTSSSSKNIAEKGVTHLVQDGMSCGSAAPNRSPNDIGPLVNEKDPLCSECKTVRPDPTEKDLIMYLHALRYKGPGFEYSTPLPDWAREDWEEG